MNDIFSRTIADKDLPGVLLIGEMFEIYEVLTSFRDSLTVRFRARIKYKKFYKNLHKVP